jgi:hypothetical protein
VLCYLGGLTQDQAAAQLGLAKGTLKGRLERARLLLRGRLSRRGLAPAVVLLADTTRPAGAALPGSLVSTTAQAAATFAAGGVAGIPAQVVQMTEGVLQAMVAAKLRCVVALLLVIGLLTAGTGVLASRGTPDDPPTKAESPNPAQGGLVRGEAAAKAPASEPVWGTPLKGLRLGLCRTEAKEDGTARLMVVLDNVGADDLVVNLGILLGNGKKQVPTAIRLIFTDAEGKQHILRRNEPGVAGRVDPFVVPLPAGSRYATASRDLGELIDRLAPGRYRVRAEFVGEAVRKKDVNADTAGLALMTYWTGTIQTAECQSRIGATEQPTRAKKLDETIAELRDAVRRRPESDKAHHDLGDALLAKGELNGAVASFREALKLNPTNASAYDSLGVALRRQGKLTEAEACFRQAIRLAPQSARAYTNLGLTLIDQNKPAEAVAAYKEAIRLDPTNVSAYFNLGNVLHGDEAIACYRKAIARDP